MGGPCSAGTTPAEKPISTGGSVEMLLPAAQSRETRLVALRPDPAPFRRRVLALLASARWPRSFTASRQAVISKTCRFAGRPQFVGAGVGENSLIPERHGGAPQGAVSGRACVAGSVCADAGYFNRETVLEEARSRPAGAGHADTSSAAVQDLYAKKPADHWTLQVPMVLGQPAGDLIARHGADRHAAIIARKVS